MSYHSPPKELLIPKHFVLDNYPVSSELNSLSQLLLSRFLSPDLCVGKDLGVSREGCEDL